MESEELGGDRSTAKEDESPMRTCTSSSGSSSNFEESVCFTDGNENSLIANKEGKDGRFEDRHRLIHPEPQRSPSIQTGIDSCKIPDTPSSLSVAFDSETIDSPWTTKTNFKSQKFGKSRIPVGPRMIGPGAGLAYGSSVPFSQLNVGTASTYFNGQTATSVVPTATPTSHQGTFVRTGIQTRKSIGLAGTNKKRGNIGKIGPSNIRKRLNSALQIQIKDLTSRVSELEGQIQELTSENRTLKTFNQRQALALKKYEGTESDFPRVLNTQQNEVKYLQKLLRTSKLNCRSNEIAINKLNAKIFELETTKRQLKKLVDSENLEEREILQKQLKEMESHLQSYQAKFKEINYQFKLFKKNNERLLNKAEDKCKTYSDKIYEAEQEIYRLMDLIKQKDRVINYLRMRMREPGIEPPLHRKVMEEYKSTYNYFYKVEESVECVQEEGNYEEDGCIEQDAGTTPLTEYSSQCQMEEEEYGNDVSGENGDDPCSEEDDDREFYDEGEENGPAQDEGIFRTNHHESSYNDPDPNEDEEVYEGDGFDLAQHDANKMFCILEGIDSEFNGELDEGHHERIIDDPTLEVDECDVIRGANGGDGFEPKKTHVSHRKIRKDGLQGSLNQYSSRYAEPHRWNQYPMKQTFAQEESEPSNNGNEDTKLDNTVWWSSCSGHNFTCFNEGAGDGVDLSSNSIAPCQEMFDGRGDGENFGFSCDPTTEGGELDEDGFSPHSEDEEGSVNYSDDEFYCDDNEEEEDSEAEITTGTNLHPRPVTPVSTVENKEEAEQEEDASTVSSASTSDKPISKRPLQKESKELKYYRYSSKPTNYHIQTQKRFVGPGRVKILGDVKSERRPTPMPNTTSFSSDQIMKSNYNHVLNTFADKTTVDAFSETTNQSNEFVPPSIQPGTSRNVGTSKSMATLPTSIRRPKAPPLRQQQVLDTNDDTMPSTTTFMKTPLYSSSQHSLSGDYVHRPQNNTNIGYKHAKVFKP